MKTLGAKWCPASTTTYAFGTESQVWYYDGARVYFQIADYTRDRAWETCALRIAQQYRDFVIANNGRLPAWRVFTTGLRMAWERTSDDRYRQAVVLLSKNSAAANYAVAVNSNSIRETAYIVDAYIDAELVGEPRNPRLTRHVDYLIGHYDQIFVSRTYELHQVFFDGTAAEALIRYYDLTRDSRVPPTVKLLLDWVWDYGWHKSRRKLVINPEPLGPKCTWGCQEYTTDLISFVSPAFAWYWSVTGNPVYQQRGDELFSHSLDEDISYSGKSFSHNFRWSFSGVAWRQSEKMGDGCTYSVSPQSSSIPANGAIFPVSVSTVAGCEWTSTSSAAWATTERPNHTGTEVVGYKVEPNLTGIRRTAVLEVAKQRITIEQAAAGCSPVVQSGPFWLSAGGGSITVQVTADATCTWQASTVSWLAIAGANQRTGSDGVTYSATANTTGATRAIMVNIAGKDVYIGQTAAANGSAATACTYNVTQGPFWIAPAGGSVTVNVTPSSSSCIWSAGASSPWLVLTGSVSRTGTGSVVYTATSNSGSTTRALMITVAGKLVYIGQNPVR
jgi:hypothetical protein